MNAADSADKTRWEEILQIWADNRWLYGVVGLLLGILAVPAVEQVTGGDLNALIGNLVPEAVGIIFTVLILDRLAENRSREALKTRLFNEMRSSAIGQGTAALAWLKREGWITDTTLIGADLHRANWENAFIGGLNLEGANLNGAVLNNVTNQFTDEQGSMYSVPVKCNHAALRHAQLNEGVLIGVELRGANLKKAHLKNAVLIGSQFICADLMEADLQSANLIQAQLSGANLQGANLERVRWDNPQGENPAILPDGDPWTPDTVIDKFTNPSHPEFAETLAKINRVRVALGYEQLPVIHADSLSANR